MPCVFSVIVFNASENAKRHVTVRGVMLELLRASTALENAIVALIYLRKMSL